MLKAPIAIILSMLTLPAATLYGAIYELEGQVTAGESLFPPVVEDLSIPFNEYGLPAGGFPVDFVARLEIGTEPTDWSFEFTLSDTERSVKNGIGGPNQHFPGPIGLPTMLYYLTIGLRSNSMTVQQHFLKISLYILILRTPQGNGVGETYAFHVT